MIKINKEQIINNLLTLFLVLLTFTIGYIFGTVTNDSNHVIDINTNNETVKSIELMTKYNSREFGSCTFDYLISEYYKCTAYHDIDIKHDLIPDECIVILDYADLVGNLEDSYLRYE